MRWEDIEEKIKSLDRYDKAYIEKYAEIIETFEKQKRTENITQEQIKSETGLTQSQISRLSKIEHRPRLDTILKVLHAVGLDLKVVKKG